MVWIIKASTQVSDLHVSGLTPLPCLDAPILCAV